MSLDRDAVRQSCGKPALPCFSEEDTSTLSSMTMKMPGSRLAESELRAFVAISQANPPPDQGLAVAAALHYGFQDQRRNRFGPARLIDSHEGHIGRSGVLALAGQDIF